MIKALCITMALAWAALFLVACDGGSNQSTSPTHPSVGPVYCKSAIPQTQIGNTTINNVTVDCGDATAEPFFAPEEE